MSKCALRVWRAAEAGGPLRDLIEWGKRIEAKGRELAARREEAIGSEDLQWIEQLDYWHYVCISTVRDFEDIVFTESEIYVIASLFTAIRHLYFPADAAVISGEGRPRKTPISEFARKKLDDLVEYLRDYNSEQKKLSGRNGIWLLDTVPLEQYSWSAFLNDLDSCFHQFLNWLTMKTGTLVEVTKRVYASTKSMPVAVECAKAWSLSVDKYHEWRLYDFFDYGALGAFVIENKGEFRVGSAAGHATHVEFYPLYARAEYYDDDEGVHEVFMRLAEHYGCRVVDHEMGVYTTVEVPRASLLDFFRGVLPFVTSMDFRLVKPDVFWCKQFCREYEELKGVPSSERELRLCITAYDRLKREGY
jgi:hypothetical protein